MSSPTFNHAYSFGFSLENQSEDGELTTAPDVRNAILRALAEISDNELLENIGCPFDTYEVEL